MDNRLIFLYPYICDVVTERANQSAYWMAVQARYLVHRQIRALEGEDVMGSERFRPSSEVDDASSREKLLA